MISIDQINRGARAREVMAIFAFALLACAGMYLDKAHGVPIYIVSLLIIGGAVTFLKRDNVRIAGLLAIVLLSAASIGINGVKFGIDFSGGVRIPVLLSQPVDASTMEDIVNTVKTRAASFGLTEVKVQPVGDSELYVELPQSSPQLVTDVENLLSQQGVYEGVVDGKIAIKGDDIYTGTINRIPSQYLQGADWGVGFSVTQAGAQRFASAVKGKGNYPLYMFLDRPSNSVVIISEKELLASAKTQTVPLSKSSALSLANAALRLEGDDVRVYLEEDLAKNMSLVPKDNKTRAVVTKGSNLTSALKQAGFIVVEKSEADMTPQYFVSPDSPVTDSVTLWEGVGLLSAPRLVPSVTEGIPNFSYTISGPAQGDTTQARSADALVKERNLESILKGGALPVQITLGSKTVVPAPLGEEFLRLSLIGVAFALLAISLMVALRYRHLQIIMPMIFISFAEVVILMAIIGSFTIDLSAMAGILAAIGVSVDAQIVVTDELLKKEGDMHHKLDKAFAIVTTSVTVAVVAMLPLLLLSGMVEIIGFATSTVLGSLLGLFISRPAYAAIVEHIFE
ncbi:Protein-export membrane protein SecD [uncultured archaeon]|nr:Protein-export membrane protein SecD [uncultured archaeon]